MSFLSFAQVPVKISSANAPPFIYQEEIPGYGCGLGCDIVKAAFQSVSYKAEFQIKPMTRMVWSLIEKKSAANMGVFRWYQAQGVESQVEKVDILMMNFVFFYRKSRFPDGVTYRQLSDLSPYTISAVRGTFLARAFEEAGLKISYNTRVEQGILKLEAGRVDLTVISLLSGWQVIRERYPDDIDQFATIEKPLLKEPVSLMFRKEDHQLSADFLRGMKKIVSNGIYEMTLVKYFRRAGIDTGLITENVPLYLQTPDMEDKSTQWSNMPDSGHLFRQAMPAD
ncbi:substrate-binding periplasmic protein [Vibrio aerogenes]|nr:transporter substrate-binding domain-containing protein [Vibrio aerogenes]